LPFKKGEGRATALSLSQQEGERGGGRGADDRFKMTFQIFPGRRERSWVPHFPILGVTPPVANSTLAVGKGATDKKDNGQKRYDSITDRAQKIERQLRQQMNEGERGMDYDS
jgi:hypothetical protein